MKWHVITCKQETQTKTIGRKSTAQNKNAMCEENFQERNSLCIQVSLIRVSRREREDGILSYNSNNLSTDVRSVIWNE